MTILGKILLDAEIGGLMISMELRSGRRLKLFFKSKIPNNKSILIIKMINFEIFLKLGSG